MSAFFCLHLPDYAEVVVFLHCLQCVNVPFLASILLCINLYFCMLLQEVAGKHPKTKAIPSPCIEWCLALQPVWGPAVSMSRICSCLTGSKAHLFGNNASRSCLCLLLLQEVTPILSCQENAKTRYVLSACGSSGKVRVLTLSNIFTAVRCFGVDIGTKSCLGAMCNGGHSPPPMVHINGNSVSVASCLAIKKGGGKVLAGDAAEEVDRKRDDNFVIIKSFKPGVSYTADEFKAGNKYTNNIPEEMLGSIEGYSGACLKIQGAGEGGKELVIPFVVLYAIMVKNATAALSLQANDILVGTIPAYFTDTDGQIVLQAYRMGGVPCHTLFLVQEPVAAAVEISHRTDVILKGRDIVVDGTKCKEVMLKVVDLGGGTLDCTLLRMLRPYDETGGLKPPSHIDVLYTTGHHFCGGDNVDTVMAQLVTARISRELRDQLTLVNKDSEVVDKLIKVSAEATLKKLSFQIHPALIILLRPTPSC